MNLRARTVPSPGGRGGLTENSATPVLQRVELGQKFPQKAVIQLGVD